MSLLSLPQELREEIYHHCFAGGLAVETRDNIAQRFEDGERNNTLSLLAVSRELNSDLSRFLAKHVELCFRSMSALRDFREIYHPRQSSDSLPRVRNITIEFTFQEWCEFLSCCMAIGNDDLRASDPLGVISKMSGTVQHCLEYINDMAPKRLGLHIVGDVFERQSREIAHVILGTITACPAEIRARWGPENTVVRFSQGDYFVSFAFTMAEICEEDFRLNIDEKLLRFRGVHGLGMHTGTDPAKVVHSAQGT